MTRSPLDGLSSSATFRVTERGQCPGDGGGDVRLDQRRHDGDRAPGSDQPTSLVALVPDDRGRRGGSALDPICQRERERRSPAAASRSRSGESLRDQRSSSSSTSNVSRFGRRDRRRPSAQLGRLDGRGRFRGRVRLAPVRAWGSHFAQSHSPRRSGRVAMTNERSAGPYRVTASTSSVLRQSVSERRWAGDRRGSCASIVRRGRPKWLIDDALVDEAEGKHECAVRFGTSPPEGRPERLRRPRRCRRCACSSRHGSAAATG